MGNVWLGRAGRSSWGGSTDRTHPTFFWYRFLLLLHSPWAEVWPAEATYWRYIKGSTLMVATRPLRVVWGFDQPFLPGWRVHGLGRALGKQSMSIEALGPHRPLPQRVWVICCCSNTKNPSAAGFLSIHASFPCAFSLVMFVWESGWEYWKQPSVVDDCTGADNRS